MPGNTATIDLATLRVQWDSHSTYASICTHWTITRDQLIRLRDVLPLAKRHDRRLRLKPPRAPRPDAAEIEASRASLSLAPQIAERVTVVQSTWSHEVRMARRCAESSPFLLRWIEPGGVIRKFLADDQGEDDEEA